MNRCVVEYLFSKVDSTLSLSNEALLKKWLEKILKIKICLEAREKQFALKKDHNLYLARGRDSERERGH